MLTKTRHWNAAALSLLVPGWGQFEQQRLRAGYTFLIWALVACCIALVGPAFGVPVLVTALDLLVVTAWSAVDALLAPQRDQACLPLRSQ